MLAVMRVHTVLLVLAVGCGSTAPSNDAAVTAPDVSVSQPGPDGAAPASDSAAPATDTAAPAADVAPAEAIDPALAQQARGFAAQYLSWGRVDDEYHWAPGLCRLPNPGVARVSASMDGTTHGQKLYSVFVKHFKQYPAGPHDDQVVVKQSWTIERVTDPNIKYEPEKYRPTGDAGYSDAFYPYALKDGVLYKADQPAGLYLMFKLAAGTPNTDGGWAYATIRPDGQVTAAGKVKSCIGCHQEAPHDRLFGVPKSIEL